MANRQPIPKRVAGDGTVLVTTRLPASLDTFLAETAAREQSSKRALLHEAVLALLEDRQRRAAARASKRKAGKDGD